MTEQEKIREGIAQQLYSIDYGNEANWGNEVPPTKEEYWAVAERIIRYLHSQGLVIRVNRELPDTALTKEDFDELDKAIIEDMTETWRIGGRRPTAEFAGKRLAVLAARKQDAKTRDKLRAGYAAVKPLRKEVKDD